MHISNFIISHKFKYTLTRKVYVQIPSYTEILDNTVDGSSTLLQYFIQRTLLELQSSTLEAIHRIAHEFQQKYGAMGIIDLFCNRIQSIQDIPTLQNYLQQQLQQLKKISLTICENLVQNYSQLPQHVLTFSNSGLILSCIVQLNKSQLLTVYIPRSSPGDEGLQFRQSLIKQGLEPNNLKLIHDTQIEKIISTIHPLLILIGCDRFTEHAILNKIGTCTILTTAAKHKQWVNILATESKKGKSDRTHELLEWCIISKNTRVITENSDSL